MHDVIRITLDDWMSLNGCSFIVSDCTLNKCKFPHGLPDRFKRELDRMALDVSFNYSEKRRELQQEYCKLVEVGKILPLTTLENNICRCAGNPELDSTKASKSILWKRTQKLPNNKLKCRIDIDNLYNTFGPELDDCIIDTDNKTLVRDGSVIYQNGECCLISSCNDDSLCLFGYTNNGTISLTYKEMRASIYGDSLERAKELVNELVPA